MLRKTLAIQLILGGLLFANSMAYAQGEVGDLKSEVFYQPRTQQSVISLNLYSRFGVSAGLIDTTTDVEVGTYELGTNMVLDFDYIYGLSDQHALSVGSSFGSESPTINMEPSGGDKGVYKREGLGDLRFGYRGIFNLGIPLFLGVSFDVSPQARTQATSTETGSRHSGGMTLSPYMGTLFRLGGHNIGLKVTQTQVLSREEDSANGGKTKWTGGHSTQMTPFWEMAYGDGMVGAQIDFISYSSLSGSSSTGTSSYSGHSEAGAILFASYDFSTDLSAKASYGNFRASNVDIGSAFKKVNYTAHRVDIGLRFGF